MSVLEGKSRRETVDEVKTKFWPTYKVQLQLLSNF